MDLALCNVPELTTNTSSSGARTPCSQNSDSSFREYGPDRLPSLSMKYPLVFIAYRLVACALNDFHAEFPSWNDVLAVFQCFSVILSPLHCVSSFFCKLKKSVHRPAVIALLMWRVYGERIGYLGLMSGKLTADGYLVKVHGHITHISARQYWLVNALGLIAICCWVGWFFVRASYRRTGDLQRHRNPPHTV